jgi:hypothetical protein
LVALGLLGFGAGCHLLPVHRVDPSIDPRRLSRANEPESLSDAPVVPPAERSVPLPPLPLQVMTDSEALQGPAPVPTPLLDAALQRADAMQESLTADLPVTRAAHESAEPTAPAGAAHRIVPDLVRTTSNDPLSREPGPEPEAEPPMELALAEPATLPPTPKPQALPVKPSPAEPVTEPAESVDPWADGLAALQAFASSKLAKGDENAEDWRLRRRLLDWLSQEQVNAGPMDASWSSVLSILAAATPEDGAVDLKATARALQEQAPLQITGLRLCRKVRGYGDYDPVDAELRPKQGVVLYCELNGVAAEEKDGLFHSRLDATISLEKPDSDVPVWSQSLERAVDVCRRRRLDYYVAYRLSLPDSVDPGTYTLTVRQHDAVADRDVTESMELVVKAP